MIVFNSVNTFVLLSTAFFSSLFCLTKNQNKAIHAATGKQTFENKFVNMFNVSVSIAFNLFAKNVVSRETAKQKVLKNVKLLNIIFTTYLYIVSDYLADFVGLIKHFFTCKVICYFSVNIRNIGYKAAAIVRAAVWL